MVRVELLAYLAVPGWSVEDGMDLADGTQELSGLEAVLIMLVSFWLEMVTS